ncbi:MAG TPA: hypothetical protein VGL47_07750 [Amycolatopsis sp.]|uniref:hypothetical protein n=1 Tax=Amycolatopsis sp. TaxID=37632 RepID=UPI002F41C364
MSGFVAAATGFPAVLFSFLLVVVIGYWLLALLGAVDLDHHGGLGDGLFAGFGGVPLAIPLSLLTAFSWFLSLAGTVVLQAVHPATPVRVLLGVAVLLVALVLGALATRVLVVPLRRLFSVTEPTRADFVGRACVIRTSTVTHDFGQAEVTAADGSSAIVQVRMAGEGNLHAGSRVVIHDYDSEGEFFWVSPLELEAEKD